jgi:hypothetical protein
MSTLNKLEIFNRNLDEKKRRETHKFNTQFLIELEKAKSQATAERFQRMANDNA